jgi:hypothetical protein
MKAFHCDHCGSLVFFESVQCVKCGRALGFLPELCDMSTLEAAADGLSKALAPAAQGRLYRQCLNGQQHQVCNWLVPVEDADPFCGACRLNETIPDLATPGNHERWHKLELAKRRIVYTLRHLGLSVEGAPGENRPALRFRFLADPESGPRLFTGHLQGMITVNIAEADDEERERRRVDLHEPLRTLLGHLRHEIAHYYWDQLISWTPRLDGFRQLFGNEEWDYEGSLWAYYEHGAPADWQSRFISAYASAHPWEDWAETWAHYLHIVDTVETAASFGMTLNPTHPDAKAMTADPVRVAQLDAGFDRVIECWLPLTYAMNTLNRGMGLPDLYPFVLSAPVIEKLRFIHEIVRALRMNQKTVGATD